VREQVEAVVADVLRPLVEADGGRIEVIEVDEGAGTVTITLSGACAGCPGAPYTRTRVVEPALEAALGRPVRVRFVPAPTVS
jgi:Fe-S cluster biogenesis protein NfuA